MQVGGCPEQTGRVFWDSQLCTIKKANPPDNHFEQDISDCVVPFIISVFDAVLILIYKCRRQRISTTSCKMLQGESRLPSTYNQILTSIIPSL